MLNFKKIEKLAKNLHESAPKIIQDLTYDLDIKIQKMLHDKMHIMHFITRKEFNLQSHILLKTQKKLIQLEEKIKILEKKIKFNKYKKYKRNQ